MPEYFIYKITCKDNPEYIYIGSTNNFNSRKYLHKSSCNNGNNKKLYNTIRENGNWENWNMDVIEKFESTTREAKAKEEEYRINMNANLNMRKCHLTEQEQKEYHKNYRKLNNEKLKEIAKRWLEKNQDYHKKYYRKNKM